MHEVVTLEEYANHLMAKHEGLDAVTALQSAQELFMERGKAMKGPMTRFEIYYEEELLADDVDIVGGPRVDKKQKEI